MFFRRDVLQSSRKIRRQNFFKKFSVLFALALSATLSLSALSDLDSLLVRGVEIRGNKAVSDTEIFKAIKQNLSGRYLGLFNKQNALVYSVNGIEDAIKDGFSRIDAAKVEKGDDNKIIISVVERKPEYVYCVGEKSLQCFYLDKTGIIFDHAPEFSEDVFFKIYGEASSTESILGTMVMNEEIFNGFMDFKKEIGSILEKDMITPKELDKKIYGLTIKDFDDYEFLVSSGNGKWKILFNVPQKDRYILKNQGVLKGEETQSGIQSVFAEISRNLQATVSSPVFLDNFKKPARGLQYIDLRFGNKVVFKF